MQGALRPAHTVARESGDTCRLKFDNTLRATNRKAQCPLHRGLLATLKICARAL